MQSPTPIQLIVILCTAEVFSMLGAATFPALLPTFIETWSMSKTDAGWVNGVYYAGYLVAVPFLVSLTDRVSPRLILTVCMTLTVFSNLGFALWVDGFWSASAFRVIGGMRPAEWNGRRHASWRISLRLLA